MTTDSVAPKAKAPVPIRPVGVRDPSPLQRNRGIISQNVVNVCVV